MTCRVRRETAIHRRTSAIDAFLFDKPFAQNWDGKNWRRGEQLGWIYGSHVDAMIQPLVGTDAAGKTIVYSPPRFMRLK